MRAATRAWSPTASGRAGTLIAIDRDPSAEAHEPPPSLGVRFVRARLRHRPRRPGRRRASARTPSTSTSACPRCRSTSASAASPTPTTRRWTCGWTRDHGESAHDAVNTWDQRRLAKVIRDYGEERYANRIASRDRPPRGPLETTFELVDAITAAIPAPARFAGGHPAKRTFQALRIAVNDELAQIDAALPLAWELLATGGRLAAISFHSLEDRRVKRFLADRAQGCVCPPDLPICVCGHEPEAELIGRGGVVPTPGEIAAQPARALRASARRR